MALGLIGRRFGRGAGRRAAELRDLTRRTGHEYGSWRLPSGLPAPAFTSGSSQYIDFPEESIQDMRAAARSNRPAETWDVHTHPYVHTVAPSRGDVLGTFSEPNFGRHWSAVLSPAADDLASEYLYRFERRPGLREREAMFDRTFDRARRMLRYSPEHQASAYDAMRSTGEALPDEHLLPWIEEILPRVMRSPRLSEPDMFGGDLEYRLRASRGDPFRPGADYTDAVRDLYRHFRARGYRGGGGA